MDVMEANHPTLAVYEDNLTKFKAGAAVLEEHVPGPAHGEQTLMIKLEPSMEDYQTPSQFGTSNGPAASEPRQLWTVGVETSADATEQTACALVPDASRPSSGPYEAADEQQERVSPRKNLPFVDHKPGGGAMTSEQLTMGIQLPLAPAAHDQARKREVVVREFATANERPHKGGVFEASPIASLEESSEQDFFAHNCFICSSCGKSFDSFSGFQMHQCNNPT